MLSKEHIETRYYIEHRMFPNILFGAARAFLPQLMEKQGQIMVSMYHGMNEDTPNYSCPYDPNDFIVQSFNSTMVAPDQPLSTYTICKIDMPKPEMSPLCYRVYICLQREQKKVAYYTVEHIDNNFSIIGGWDNNKNHLNYGSSLDSPEQELEFIQLLYTQGSGHVDC